MTNLSLKHKLNLSNQSGFVASAMALIILVISVIALSTSTRVNQEATRSIQEAESTRTLEGAERGLEKGLSQDFVVDDDPNSEYNDIEQVDGRYQIETKEGGGNLPIQVLMEEGEDLSFEGVLNNNFTISWGRKGKTNKAILLISTISEDNIANYFLIQSTDATNGKGWSNAEATLDEDGQYKNKIKKSEIENFPTDAELVRIKVFGEKTDLKLDCPECKKPVARKIIAQAGNKQDAQNRTTEIYESWPMAPTIFDFALYSDANITMN